MSKVKWIVVAGFLLAFAAGLTAGALVRHGKAPGRGEGSWLTEQLHLDPQQAEQMRKIWSDAMRSAGRETDEARRTARKERDEAVAALFNGDQKAQYERIQQEYSQKMTRLSQQREASLEKAVEQTKQILNPEQRQKYEEILKTRGPGGRGGHGPGRRGERMPATLPATTRSMDQGS